VLHSSCNMGICDLADMHVCSPWALCIHIRQFTHFHATTMNYTMHYIKLDKQCVYLLIIVKNITSSV